MKFFLVILTFLSLLLVESSSSSLNDTSVSNITRGSSLSTSSNVTSRYWLSPSGNFSFGFNQLPCTHSPPNCTDTYVVGIWSGQTLVWIPNLKDLLPLHKPSSILFTNQGNLVLRTMSDDKETPLIPDVQEPVSYAIMHDNGNFVLYGSESQIVWESFDYPIPTDTILGGRKLRPGGVGPISGGNRLSITQISTAAGASSELSNQDGPNFPDMSKTGQIVAIVIACFVGLPVVGLIVTLCYMLMVGLVGCIRNS